MEDGLRASFVHQSSTVDKDHYGAGPVNMIVLIRATRR